MRSLALLLLAVISGGILLALSDNVAATANCGNPLANSCRGEAAVGTTTGGVASGRCFFFTARSTTPTCTTGGIVGTANQAWELDPGACMTLYYWDIANGAAPPAVPNKVTLLAQFDGLATVIKNYQTAGAEPANGATFTFCATTNGDVGSAARAGVVHISVNAIKDNGNGLPGNTNYNVVSTGAGTQDTSFDLGFLRGKTTVSSITHSAYPSGSTFAYGPGSDETITITSTFTPPFGDAGLETVFNSILDESTLLVGQVGATTDFDGTGSFAQGFTSDATFPFANSPYVGGLTITGNSAFGITWTVLTAAGHGANLVRVSDTFIYDSTDFNIDPRIIFDSDGSGTFATADDMWLNKLDSSSGTIVSKYNRGETAYVEGYLFNARDQQLTRSMTISLEDAGAVVCNTGASLTPSSGKYSTTYTVPTGGSCTVANTDAGSPRYLRATNTDQNTRSSQDNAVSSLYYVDSHIQLSGTLTVDDYPTEDASEDLEYFVRSDGGGGDDSDTIHLWCGVQSVRKDVNIDTTGTAVSGNIKDPTTTTRASMTGDTGSNGFTATSIDLLATTPLGDAWTANCSVSYLGNTGTDTETFEVGVEGGGGETVYTGADPLTIFAGSISNGTVPIAIHSRMLDGEARVGAAASIFVSVFEWPSLASVITGASVVEVDATNAPGAYAYNFTPPYPGSYLVSANTTDGATDIGAHTVIQTASLLEHSDNSLEVSMVSNFAGLGFDGFLIVLFWIAAILFFSYMGWLVALAFAVPGLLQTVIPELPFDFTTYLLLCLLGFILEVAANKWSWGGYQSGKRRLKIGV